MRMEGLASRAVPHKGVEGNVVLDAPVFSFL